MTTCRSCGAILRRVNAGRGSCDPCELAQVERARRLGGPPRPARPETIAQSILGLLAGGEATVAQIIAVTGAPDNTVRKMIWSLMARGQVERGRKVDGYRTYRLREDVVALVEEAG